MVWLVWQAAKLVSVSSVSDGRPALGHVLVLSFGDPLAVRSQEDWKEKIMRREHHDKLFDTFDSLSLK